MPLASWWKAIRHFKPAEFDSPDARGSGALHMERGIVEIVDDVREIVGEPLTINSGYRTAAHNRKVGGKPTSAHLHGWAVDIACATSDLRFKIVAAAVELVVPRIGIAPTFVHLDCDPNLPQGVVWLY